MHIKKISVRNFKSFGRKAEIPLYGGFTVISGPNGSGKSNIIDSILFCLGLSHSSKLRADRLTDLIHSGNGNLDSAEVTIVFDNSDGLIPGEPEIAVTRKIRMTEKGYYSYYYINGKNSSLADLHKLLAYAGIHSDTYNVIMQGDVTRITEMTPFQRRKIIDDVAGISEFDEKKEKAIEELEKVRENMDRIGTILAEVTSRLEQLSKDKDEALRYKSLINKKELNESYLKAHRYKNLLSRNDKIKKDIEELEKEKDYNSKSYLDAESKIQNLTLKAEEISLEISEKSDDEFQKIQDKIIEINSEIESIKKSEQFYKTELTKLEEEKTNALIAISKLKDELESIGSELDKLLMQKITVQEVVNDTQAKIEETKSKLQVVDAKFKEIKDELLKHREELERLKEQKSELVREQDKRLESIRRIGLETDELQREKENLQKTISEMEGDSEIKGKDFERIEKELERKIKERNDIDKNLFSLRDQLSSFEEELKSKEVSLAKVKAKISALKPFSKSVELILEAKRKKALPGVYGTVSQLGEVNEKYVLALEVAAGGSLQFLVVENENDAIRAINYLKQIRGGRATFLPLNKIKRNMNLKPLPKENGVIDYAINLVKFDKRFEPVFNFIYRDTLVVDNIQTAKKLMDGRRIVTLEGDLTERSGSMTGGSISQKSGMLLSKELLEKEKSIMEDISILNSKKAGIIGDIRLKEQNRKSIQDEIDLIENEINEIRNKESVIKSRIEDSKNRISEIENRIALKNDERNKIYGEMSQLEGQIKEINVKIENTDSEIKKLEKMLKGSEIPELTSTLDKLKDEFSRNKESLISIEKKIENVEFRKEQTEKLKAEKEIDVQRSEDEKAEITANINSNQERISKLTEEYEILKKEEERVGKKVKELRDERDKVLDKIKEEEKEKQRISFKITTLNEKINAKKDTLQTIDLEIKEIREISEFDIKIINELPPYQTVTSELQKIEESLAEFGDVNLKAIQEYDEVKNRKDELDERKQTLETESNEIIKRIEKYERMKRESFFDAFSAISRNFTEIIYELTDGEGELYLDDEDPFKSGMHIKVKIRNKSPRRLDSMSGGEKSLVALALIFAIQKYKPAPFYALDEIDMFLDGVNVGRVAKMIKNRSDNAQFVVVSLRKPMLETAQSIIGVTQGRDNSSLVTGIKMKA